MLSTQVCVLLNENIAIYFFINLEEYVSHCISDCLELPEDYKNEPCIYDETNGHGNNFAGLVNFNT